MVRRPRFTDGPRDAWMRARQAGIRCVLRGLTFDMRGGRQLAKPDVARPLDGRVRAHSVLAVLLWIWTTNPVHPFHRTRAKYVHRLRPSRGQRAAPFPRHRAKAQRRWTLKT